MTAANHFSSTNRAQLTYIKESDFGVLPTSGNGAYLRMTGETFNWNLTKQADKEIRSDRQLSSTTTVSANAAGDLKVHMQYAEYDPLLAGLMQNDWVMFGTNGVGTTFTADFTATTITASVATTGANAFTNLKKGQWFRLLAPSNANNGRLLRVSTVTAPTATVITLDAGTPAAVASAVANCAIQSSRLSNGVTMPTFSFERAAADVGQFFTFTGMAVSKFSTSFASGSLVEATFSFMGKSSGAPTTVTSMPGTTVASKPYDITNAVSGVAQVWEGGAPITGTAIKSMTLDIDNSLRGQEAIGTLGYAGIGVGTFMVKGSMEVYFADAAIYTKFISDAYTSVVLSVQDTAGNGYVFSLPRVNLTSGKVNAEAKDGDMMLSFEYEAYGDMGNADATLRQTLFIDRVGVAVPNLF